MPERVTTWSKDTNPEQDVVVLELESGRRLIEFKQYRFHNDFLTPIDTWSVTIAPGDVNRQQKLDLLREIQIGASIKFYVNGYLQTTGYIDEVDIRRSKVSGLEIEIEGRNRLGYAVDSNVDPRTSFKPTQSLEELIFQVLGPFGFTTLVIDNDDARTLASGSAYGAPTRKYTKKKKKPIKNYKLDHQSKPYPTESAYAFVSRVLNRNGLWLWSSPDGETLIAGAPSYNQAPLYQLRRKNGPDGVDNNISSGGVRRSGKEQPSIIIGYGQCGVTPDFNRAKHQAMILNPSVDAGHGNTTDIIAKHPLARLIEIDDIRNFEKFQHRRARPAYIFDQNARKAEELANYLRREVSLRMRKALVATYNVPGHTCNGSVWTMDTLVNVHDEDAELYEDMWLMSRTLTGSRSQGKMTQLELVRPGSFQISDPSEQD